MTRIKIKMWCRVALTLAHVVLGSISLAIMLIAMSFNVGLLTAIVIGEVSCSSPHTPPLSLVETTATIP